VLQQYLIILEIFFAQANIHSFLEADDRVGLVMKFMDDALAELENLDGLISSYKIHLNVCDSPMYQLESFLTFFIDTDCQ
jgi:hypothetical protein